MNRRQFIKAMLSTAIALPVGACVEAPKAKTPATLRLMNDGYDGKPFHVPTQSKHVRLDIGGGKSLDALVHWPSGELEQPNMKTLGDGRYWRGLQFGTNATEQGATIEVELPDSGDVWVVERYRTTFGTNLASFHYTTGQIDHAVDFYAVESVAVYLGDEEFLVLS